MGGGGTYRVVASARLATGNCLGVGAGVAAGCVGALVGSNVGAISSLDREVGDLEVAAASLNSDVTNGGGGALVGGHGDHALVGPDLVGHTGNQGATAATGVQMGGESVGTSLTCKQDTHALTRSTPKGSEVEDALPVARPAAEGEGGDDCEASGLLHVHAPKIEGRIAVEGRVVAERSEAGDAAVAAPQLHGVQRLGGVFAHEHVLFAGHLLLVVVNSGDFIVSITGSDGK